MQHSLEEVFAVSHARAYFLQELNKCAMMKESYYTRLADQKFLELGEILMILIRQMEEPANYSPECEYLILQINNRIVKKNNNIQKTYLSEMINQSTLWTTKSYWNQLFEYIRQKKL